MSRSLREQAKQLARQPYKITITNDETTDGEPIFVLYTPELPGCMAQGTTLAEAHENLSDAREEYILSLLEDNLPVPAPGQYAIQSGTGPATINLAFAIGSNLITRPTVVPEPKGSKQLTEITALHYEDPHSLPDQGENLDTLETSIEVRQI
jgi:predicted RNase H-like HicB family nuclease